MSCPDIHSLIDSLEQEEANPEMEAHLHTCPSCRGYLELLREIPEAFHAEVDVPEALVQRVMAGIPEVDVSPAKQPTTGLQTLGAGVLGWATAVAAIVATGSAENGGPATILLVSVIVGLIASLIQLRLPEDWDPNEQPWDRRQAS
jgi:anti-sigma factor RsiW